MASFDEASSVTESHQDTGEDTGDALDDGHDNVSQGHNILDIDKDHSGARITDNPGPASWDSTETPAAANDVEEVGTSEVRLGKRRRMDLDS